MNSRSMSLIIVALTVLLATVSGCEAKAPPSTSQQTSTQSLKIPSQEATGNPAAPALPAQPAGQAAPENAGPATVEDDQAEQPPSELVQESLKIATTYDPAERFDPFEPLFKDEPKVQVDVKKKKPREPLTPLEQVALSQLKLSAIIRAPSGNRALVEDATGKGFVVEKGTFMGLNSGKVIRIEQDRIVVEEEIESLLGELTLRNTEIKLQKPAGEL